MVTLEQVRTDLREIKYYYAKQKELDNASKYTGQSAIIDRVNTYNKAMRQAPVLLYDLYVSLYVNNNTQSVLAYDWDCSTEYVKRLNKQLCGFLQNELEKQNKEKGELL